MAELPTREVFVRNVGETAKPTDVTNVPKTEIRYALYSPAKGVYLGGGLWTSDRLDGPCDSAQTYTVAEIKELGLDKQAEAHQCFPDLPFNRASKNAVANAGLPRW